MSKLPHRPVWMQLASSTGRGIVGFYEAVLGWSAAESSEEFGGYFMFFTPAGLPAAGAMPMEQPSSDWLLYVQTGDIEASLAKADAAGGSILQGVQPIADLGTMAIVADPSGCAIGLWQPAAFAGFPLDASVGAPAWFELYTKDYEGSQAFLTETFGWKFDPMSDTEDFRYATVSLDGQPVVGIMDFSAEVHAAMPPYWNTYLAVEDCDAAAAAAVAAGGELLIAPNDSPFGRMASLRDPAGAIFSLNQAAR